MTPIHLIRSLTARREAAADYLRAHDRFVALEWRLAMMGMPEQEAAARVAHILHRAHVAELRDPAPERVP